MKPIDWISTGTAAFKTQGYPTLAFPAKSLPDLFAPNKTILTLGDGSQSHTWLWCYSQRKVHGRCYLFNPTSLSPRRIQDLPRALERLGKWFVFEGSSSRTVWDRMNKLSALMNWLDLPQHQGQYEAVLSDPALALEALQRHHTHLRQRMQSNTASRISEHSAGSMDSIVIMMMSEIQGRDFRNDIEPIRMRRGLGVEAPKLEDVAAFMACAQGVFDSVVTITTGQAREVIEGGPFYLRWQSRGQEVAVQVKKGIHVGRLMELGCMAYAALCLGDSGANLAQIQAYEEPDDLEAQLSNPERLSLKQKVIKLRAGGKAVPVNLTAVAVTRIRSYLSLREALRVLLVQPGQDPDIPEMFIQCEYKERQANSPRAIQPIQGEFTSDLRRRFNSFGIQVPAVTMQQLRTFRNGALAREHSPEIAAAMTGNTVATSLRAYFKVSEEDARSEMAPFLEKLTSAVVQRNTDQKTNAVIPVPAGGCRDHGHPVSLVEDPLVEPDCSKTEGCFFCDKFAVHANEEDAAKLLSCKHVLARLPTGETNGKAVRVYRVVMGRIDTLLAEIQRLAPVAHAAALAAIQRSELHPFWQRKLQQLHLLGMLQRAEDPQ